MSSDKSSWNHFARLKVSSKDVNKRLRKIEKGSLRHAHKFVTSRLDRLANVKRRVSVWVVLVLVMIGVSAAQWSISRNSFTAMTYAAGGSYSEGVLGPLENLNPIFAKTSAEKSAAKLLFSSLYRYDSTGNIKSDLADDITINDKETEYVVKLKKNLKWSDGHSLTADDVIFTLRLLANPEARAEISGWRSIKFEKVSDDSVKFILPASYAPFIHALTFPIIPEHILKDVQPANLREHAFSKSPISSGPFAFRLLQNVTSDGSKKVLYLQANNNYHGGVAKLERFQLYVYPTQNDIAKSLRTREITGTPELIYNEQSDEVKSMYAAESHSLNNGVYALFNANSQFLHSKAIRQALAMSIDVGKLRQSLSSSTKELTGPILNKFLDKTPQALGYDVKKAKSLLDAEGWKIAGDVRKKENTKLSLSVVVLKNTNYEKVAQSLAQIWRKELNVEVDIKVVDPNDVAQNILQTVLQPRSFDVLIYELSLGGDPDVYAYWHSSQATNNGLNFSNYNNAVADDALASGRSKLSTKQRADRYAKFVAIWQADTPAIALYQPKFDYIHTRTVRALDKNTEVVNLVDRYVDVQYWATEKQSVYKTP